MGDTVIIGAGIIGCSTAFYLLKNSTRDEASNITLIDASPELFECASGRAGGFLASNCADPPELYTFGSASMTKIFNKQQGSSQLQLSLESCHSNYMKSWQSNSMAERNGDTPRLLLLHSSWEDPKEVATEETGSLLARVDPRRQKLQILLQKMAHHG
jgi:glycine/D-amino acid oxidase-like deaminating enzyme